MQNLLYIFIGLLETVKIDSLFIAQIILLLEQMGIQYIVAPVSKKN